MFYHIKQFGQVRTTYNGPPILTETVRKEVLKNIIAKAKKAIVAGDMVRGAFDVEVCNMSGLTVDNFLSGTE